MCSGNRFQDLLDRRGIDALLHFTQASNLPGIVEHGLAPRALLDRLAIPYAYSDPKRLDRQPEATSLSVSCFNWEMFNVVRDRHPGSRWVILEIDARILPGTNSRFFARNAARSEYTRSTQGFRSLHAFEGMFEDRCASPMYRGHSYRSDFSIPDFVTSDPQAEILCFDVIPAKCITGAWTDHLGLGQEVDLLINTLPGAERTTQVMEFAPRFRTDYGVWG